MSCGSKTCASIDPPNIADAAERHSWLWRAWHALGVGVDKLRRRRFRLEIEKACQRGLLKHLDDDQLKDLGLTREQVDREARKPFWK